MKKVFYFLNTLNEWVDVVAKLDDTKGWKPILWVTSEVLQEKISIHLPKTKIIDLYSHRRGEFNKIIYDNNIFLDKNILEKYFYSEKNVIAMMNRMDSTRHNFNYHQRLQLYYRILIYWITIFDKYKPDLVFFDETPHVPFEYIMHEVAVKRGIKIIRFNPTHINHRLILFAQVNKTPDYILKLYQEIQNNNSHKLSQDIEDYYKNLQGTYDKAEPYYMKKQPIKIKNTIKNIFIILQRIVLNKSDLSYQRTSNGYIQDFKIMKFIKIYYRTVGRLYKYKLFREYNALVNLTVNLEENYIYVPLHFQPERTTSPDGDIYENQWLMIQLLSKSIPYGWKLYVKEHISQFNTSFSGEMGRNIEFYKEILLFKNVKLIPLEFSSYDLIDNSKCVATVSGTVGLESICRNKRVLVFGYPWYEISEGVTHIQNREDIEHFFKKIFHQNINEDKVKAFFELIDKISLSAKHSANIWNKDFNKDENIKNLVQLIELYEDKI